MTKCILYEGNLSRVPSLLLKPAYFQGILSEESTLVNSSLLMCMELPHPHPPPPRLFNDLKA